MAATYKVLGQQAPSAATLTTLYTVPAGTQAVASALCVCNTSATAMDRFRISIQIGGAADALKQYLYYDVPVAPNDSFIANIGISLAATDVVKCYATNGTLSFNLMGTEIT